MKAASLPTFRRVLGAAIREQRTALGLSQSELAARANVKCDYVGKVERGEQNSQADTLIRFFDALTAASLEVPRRSLPPPSHMSSGMVFLQVIGQALGVSLPQVWPASEPGRGLDAAHDAAHDPINRVARRIMEACSASSRSAPDLLKSLGYTARAGSFKGGLKQLIASGLLAMTIPARPRSKNQKYRLTLKGKTWLAANPVHGAASSPSH
jgi:transcriptional regulator with XRE-family HTH domain